MKTVSEILQNIRMNMCPIRGGVFDMGDRYSIYKPLMGQRIDCVPVQLDDFHISSRLVTFGDWTAVMKGKVRTDAWTNKPLTGISWYTAQEFIEELSILLEWEFRLPTEAEWEYAARGGELDENHLFAGGDNLMKYAWFDKNSNYKSQDVCTKKPNLLGLYDMSGNVWEWCQDWYGISYPKTGFMGLFNGDPALNPKGPVDGTRKVVRGGSCCSSEKQCWVFNRSNKNPNSTYADVGFRLAY